VWEDVWRQLMITPGILHFNLLPLHHDVGKLQVPVTVPYFKIVGKANQVSTFINFENALKRQFP
jgi:hypothetical protein